MFMKTVTTLAVITGVAAQPIHAQEQTSDSFASRTTERRAVEAAIWGMPAVYMAGIRRSLAGIGAGYNQVAYFSKPLEARHEFLTGNNQTPYVVSVLDLHSGPVVLELPPASDKIALFGTVCDSWQVPSWTSGRAVRTPEKEASISSSRLVMLARRQWATSPLRLRLSSCMPPSGRS